MNPVCLSSSNMSNTSDLDHSAPTEAVCSDLHCLPFHVHFWTHFCYMKLKLQLFWVSQILGVLRYKFWLFFMSSFQGILTLLVQWKYMPQTTHKSVFFFQVSMLSKRGFLGPLWVHYFNHVYAVNVLCFIYTVKIVKYCNIYLYHIFEGLMED